MKALMRHVGLQRKTWREPFQNSDLLHTQVARYNGNLKNNCAIKHFARTQVSNSQKRPHAPCWVATRNMERTGKDGLANRTVKHCQCWIFEKRVQPTAHIPSCLIILHQSTLPEYPHALREIQAMETESTLARKQLKSACALF